MKALLALAAHLIVLWSVTSLAVATIRLNNYDSGNPVAFCGYDRRPIGLAPVQGTYVELTAMGSPIVDIATQSSIIPLTEDGFFYGGVGVVPGLADNATAVFTLRIWRAAPIWDAATQRESVTWTQATGSWDPNHDPPAPPDRSCFVESSGVFLHS